MIAVPTFSLLVLAAAAVNSYDFDDPAYNDLLAEELEDSYLQLSKRSLHPRVRREESDDGEDKCHHPWAGKHMKLCCRQDSVKSYYKGQLAKKRECLKEVMEKAGEQPPKDPFSCEDVERRKKHVKCTMQCFGQKEGMLDENGNPIKEGISKYISASVLGEASWFKDIQETVVDKCIAEAEEMKAKQESEEGSCNPSAIIVGHCIFREFQLSCPESEIKDQASCDEFKEKVKTRNTSSFGSQPSSEE